MKSRINTDLEQIREQQQLDRQKQAEQDARREQRRERSQLATQRMLAARDLEMSRPLISADLLLPQEREAIHARFRGGQRWHGLESRSTKS